MGRGVGGAIIEEVTNKVGIFLSGIFLLSGCVVESVKENIVYYYTIE